MKAWIPTLRNFSALLIAQFLAHPGFADDYSFRLAFPTHTIEGTSCSGTEFLIRPEFGVLVTDCKTVLMSEPNHFDVVPALGYQQAVRLNQSNIYTECQFIQSRRNSVGELFWYSCLESASQSKRKPQSGTD